MRAHNSDYFEISRQATFVQQGYAIRNPMEFVGYDEHCWGFTACDGPGWLNAKSMTSNASFLTMSLEVAPFGLF